ncbi:MAG TPA: ABC transporter permease, partial [Blastocatellia bacterium]|nr:ABC transporter permease [Blastocatellia bacterium]
KQDLLYAFRVLYKNRGFTAVAVLALALGIGANTAIFSVVNSVLFRPLPYRDPQRLVMLWADYQQRGGPEREWLSPADFRDYRDQTASFEHVVALLGWGPTLTGQGEPEDLQGAAVSHDTFSMLGVAPMLGRSFSAGEDAAGAERVILLSHRLWQRRFDSDPAIIGKSLTLAGESHTVIGVMPRGLTFPILSDTEVWRPIIPALATLRGCDRGCVILRMMAKLKPGVALDQARAETDAIAARAAEQHPESNKGVGSTVVPLHEQLVGDVRPAMLVLLGAVALVLLIACANVANLLLARAAAREKEVAIRAALGATRARLIRLQLTESLLLAIVGGAVGLLLAFWMVDVLVSFAPTGTPRLEEIAIDRSVLVFTFGVAVVTGLIFGLAPALVSSKTDLTHALKEGGRDARAGARGNRVRSGLVVSEVALALMLLVGAGLLIKSFVNLQRVDPGFDPKNVLRVDLQVPRTRYPDRLHTAAFYKQLMDRVAGLPGVQTAGAVSSLPLSGGGTDSTFAIEGRPGPEPGQPQAAWYAKVTPGYFRTMGIRFLQGRDFTEADTAEATKVAIISETMARRYFSGGDPVGKRLVFGEGQDKREIVGVVADVKHFGLNVDARPTMYFAQAQYAERGMSLLVRTPGDPMSLAGAIRSEVWTLDRDLAVSSVMPMEELVATSLAEPRFVLLLLGLFAAVAMALSAIGVYGVMAYTVTQRSHEIGVRMALGAQMRDVLTLVVGQGMALVGGGVALGLIAAFGLTRVMESLLFGVSATDFTTFAATSVVLALVALGACFVPARRATKVDPMIALRYE